MSLLDYNHKHHRHVHGRDLYERYDAANAAREAHQQANEAISHVRALAPAYAQALDDLLAGIGAGHATTDLWRRVFDAAPHYRRQLLVALRELRDEVEDA